jgi:F-type H+-transporting ATPase subunit alpha
MPFGLPIRFGIRLDEATRQTLARGRRVREVLKQPQYHPIPFAEQVGILLAVVDGLFDTLPIHTIAATERSVRQALLEQIPSVCQ